MKALFTILLAILVMDTTIQVNLRLLSQHVQREMRKQRILNKGQKNVQETDEEDLQSTSNKIQANVDPKAQEKVQIDTQVQNQGTVETQTQSLTQSDLTQDNYTKDELPDTAQDIKNYQERQQQLQEAMKNVTPKDQTNSLNLIIFKVFMSMFLMFV